MFLFFASLLLLGMGALFTQSRVKAAVVRNSLHACMHGTRPFSKEWAECARWLESNVGETVPFLNAFIELNGAMHTCMGRTVVHDNRLKWIIKQEDGMLCVPVSDAVDRQKAIMEQIVRFRGNLGKTPLLVCIVPDKAAVTRDPYPAGLENASVRNMEAFFDLCASNGIETVDIRDLVNHANQFFKTDHHWRLPAALQTAQRIADSCATSGILAQESVAQLQIERFDMRVLEDSFLGLLGKRVGAVWAGYDDYEFLLPTWPTFIRCEFEDTRTGTNVKRAGEWPASVFDFEILNDGSRRANRYASNFGEYASTIIVDNESAKAGNILFIRDSFGLPVLSYLALISRRIVSLDIRTSKKGAIASYVQAHPLDCVILLYYAEQLTRPDMFRLCD